MRTANSGVSGTIGAFNSIRRIGFPRTPELLTIFGAVSVAVTIVSLGPLVRALPELFGIAATGILLPSVLAELVNAMIILRRDSVLDFRRLMGIELVSLVWLSLFLIVATVAGIALSNSSLWMSGFLIGIAASLPMRTLAILTMSSRSLPRKIFAAVVPPLAITRAFFGVALPFLRITNLSTLSTGGTIAFASGIVLSLTGCLWIMRGVEKAGSAGLQRSPLELFRAFLEHWLSSRPDALEAKLKDMGSQRSIESSVLSLSRASSSEPGSVIVSNFHPGPYRDMGSSGLPSTLKRFVREQIGSVAHVPHGVSNHELNIVSRDNIEKLLLATKENFPTSHPTTTATIMIQGSSGEATVTGQLFGKTAILAITLAPSEMEDFPERVSDKIREAAMGMGLDVLVIDAHNSISRQASINVEQAEDIVRAAVNLLETLRGMDQSSFYAGVAEDSLAEFDLRDGIGPGGLSVLAVKNAGQVGAYVTVDGNNMEKGFRGIILDMLKRNGVSIGEVMTTDTHLVTGLARSPLGYYPIGAHLSRDLLLERIEDAVGKAVSGMEPSASGFATFRVTVGVLGTETFGSITSFIGSIARRIARSFCWLELFSILLAALIIYVV